jgi:hypothetical protein
MRALPPNIAAHVNDGTYSAVHLVEIRGAATYRWTDRPGPVTYGGNVFTQQPFVVSEAVADEAGSMALDLTFDDQEHVVKSMVYAESFDNLLITVYEAWLDVANGSLLDVVTIIDGRAETATVDVERAETVTLPVVQYAENEGAAAGEEYAISCRYLRRYKGAQCGYAGALASCDGTFNGPNGCVAHANQARYGGFRFAPKPGQVLVVGDSSTVVETRN